MNKHSKIRASFLALLALVAIAVWTSVFDRPAASGLLTLNVLDVGQGDSLLITTPLGHHVLVDAGPTSQTTEKIDAELPRNDRTLDLVVVSHNHSDHIGGMTAVLKRYNVSQFWLSGATDTTQTYIDMLKEIKAKNIPTTAVTAGITKTFDGVKFTVLYPLTSQVGLQPANQHDSMVVFLVEYKQKSMILTGDLEASKEVEIIKAGEITHSVDVLKVGHHGSDTSTSEAWLDTLKPSIAVISVGKNNLFGHPTPSTVKRLTNHGIQVLRTDENGTVKVISDGERVWTETEK